MNQEDQIRMLSGTQLRMQIKNIIFRLMMVVLGGVIFFWANVWEHIRRPEKINQPFAIGGTLFSIIFSLTFMWALIWRQFKRWRSLDQQRWRFHMPRTTKLLVSSLFGMYIMYSIAFFPVYGILLSFALFTALAYSLLALLSFL